MQSEQVDRRFLQYNMVPIPWPSMGDSVSSQNAKGGGDLIPWVR